LPGWCGYLMLALGVVSGVMGVLYALGQHELKKLLAYHSIENIGIICLGLGVGLIGRQYNMPVLAAAGFAGGLLHVLNHALFKGLLFLGAGSVIYRTHTGEMDRLGGLFKVMPVTGTVFLIGALAICGLPFFNGFISEFIIFASLFQGLLTLPVRGVLACAAAILALALMGALALACFTKVYGTVFLGEPRSAQDASGEKGTPLCMILPMVFLACLCAWIGIFPGRFVEFTFLGGEYLSRLSAKSVDTSFILGPLAAIVAGAAAFCCIAVSLIILRRICSGPVSAGERPQTWACGFSAVSSRMQYTSSSFAYPVIDFVKGLLLWRRRGTVVKGFFPAREHMHSSVSDVSDEYLFRPLLARLTHLSRKFYDGRVRHTQIYLLYIFLFLIFLLVWKMR
jgi:hydrogenase-4 component B